MNPLTRQRIIILTIGVATWAGTGAWYDSANGFSVLTLDWLPASPAEALGMAIFLGYALMPFAALATYVRRLGWAGPVAAALCAAFLAEGTRETLNSTSSLGAMPMMTGPFMATLAAGLLACVAGCLRRDDAEL